MDGWRLVLRLLDADDAEAGERAEAIARIKRRRRFMSSLGTYAIVNAVLWLIWALTGHDTSGFLRDEFETTHETGSPHLEGRSEFEHSNVGVA